LWIVLWIPAFRELLESLLSFCWMYPEEERLDPLVMLCPHHTGYTGAVIFPWPHWHWLLGVFCCCCCLFVFCPMPICQLAGSLLSLTKWKLLVVRPLDSSVMVPKWSNKLSRHCHCISGCDHKNHLLNIKGLFLKIYNFSLTLLWFGVWVLHC
jgi:hypothetical protein